MLGTLHNHAVVVVVDKLEVNCQVFVESHIVIENNDHAHILRRSPKPSEGSAVLTGLRLGRVGRDARVPYVRF